MGPIGGRIADENQDARSPFGRGLELTGQPCEDAGVTGHVRRSDVRPALVEGALALRATWAATVAHLRGRDTPAQFEPQVRDIESNCSGARLTDGILLSGSSFFENWKTSEQDLAPLKTVNIGIGGTRVSDHLAHFDRMVAPLRPRTLVLYIGSNDISGVPFFSKSARATVELIREYIALVHDRLPGTTVYYVAITETPSRALVRDQIRDANRLLAEHADKTGDFRFISTAEDLLTPSGEMDHTLFGPDLLHLNEAGYTRFAAAIRRGLREEYAG